MSKINKRRAMMTTSQQEPMGTCQKHGVFNLAEGCLYCIAEQRTGGPPPTLASTTSDILPEPETALTLRPGEDIEAHGYFQESLKLLSWAQGRVIATLEDNKTATDDLSIIAKLKKAMEGKRKEYLEPLRAQTEAVRETYNYLMTPVLEADKITRDKMLAYTKEQDRIRAEEEEINRKRMEAANQEMALKGELTESVNLVEVTPEAPRRVSTDMGTAGQKANWKWEIVDFSLVPREYLVVDGAQLTAIARGHHDTKPIPGVRFYNEPIIAVNAR